MVVGIVLLAFVAQERATAFHETPAWKAYTAELTRAQMIELRWTDFVKGVEVSRHVLLMRKGDMVSLETIGKGKTVWREGKGIVLDYATKRFERVSVKPAFLEASQFEIPGVLVGDGNQLEYKLKQSKRSARGRAYDVVSVTNHQIDAIAILTYTFDSQSKLLTSVVGEYVGMWEGGDTVREARVEKFDLYAMLSRDEFALDPPAGFTEKGENSLAVPATQRD